MTYTRTRPKFITFVDLETSGLCEFTNEIVEVGAIRVEVRPESRELHVVKTYSSKVFPTRPVDPGSIPANHYNPSLWAEEAVTLDEAIGHLYPMLVDARFAAWNAKFDYGFVAAAFRQLQWGWPKYSYHVLDVANLLELAYVTGKVDSFKLETNLKRMGLLAENEAQTHEAFDDIRNTLMAYALMTQFDIKDARPNRDALAVRDTTWQVAKPVFYRLLTQRMRMIRPEQTVAGLIKPEQTADELPPPVLEKEITAAELLKTL